MATDTTRRAALAGMTGAALTFLTGAAVQGIVQPTTDVSTEMWSYPWPSDALATVSVLYTALHVLILVGLLAFRRSGAAGDGRLGRGGIVMAMVGTALLAAGELSSIAVADQRVDDSGPGLVGALFGVGTVVSAVGFLLAGAGTLRAGRWDGWRRWAPLFTGLTLVALTGLAMTTALSGGVAVYGLGALAVFTGVYTRSKPAAARTRSDAVQV